MASVNKVILIGNVGKDPEMRYMQNGDAVANFSIATTDQWKDKSGAKQERTEWHRIVCFRKLGEIVGEYVTKGQSVYIEGRLQSEKYTGNDGIERTSFQIVAESLRMLGGRDKDDDQKTSAQRHGSSQSGTAGGGKPPAGNSNSGFDDFEDDIPF